MELRIIHIPLPRVVDSQNLEFVSQHPIKMGEKTPGQTGGNEIHTTVQ